MKLLMGTYFLLYLLRIASSEGKTVAAVTYDRPVSVFYYMQRHWGDSIIDGDQKCHKIICNWYQSDNLQNLHHSYSNIMSNSSINSTMWTLALWNAHSLFAKHYSRAPQNCAWRTDLTMAVTEESRARYHHQLNFTFPHFDGFSTNSPHASVQRIHKSAFLQESDLIEKPRNFSDLIKAGSYGMSIFKNEVNVDICLLLSTNISSAMILALL